MIRILHYVGKMDVGGIESLLMSIYRTIDRENFQFDFAVHTSDKCFYDDEIEKLGGCFHRFPQMRKNPIVYRKAWDDFWKVNHEKYQVFHFHTPTFANLIAMKSAKKYGVKIIIAHCHNIHANRGKLQKLHDIAHKYHRARITKYANMYFACSPAAAEWGFGRLYTDNKINVTILKNGIDLNRFTYSEDTRNKIRKEFDLSSCFVIGHVGRLCTQKNQMFLLDVFKEIKKKKKASKLLLIGSGPDENKLKNRANELNIINDVLFLGARSNIEELMMAMDSFVFPSIHEGLGIVMIEAQSVGVPVFASKNRVPYEAKVTENVKYIDLEKEPEYWAKTILDKSNCFSRNNHDQITEHGYSIIKTTSDYEKTIKEQLF